MRVEALAPRNNRHGFSTLWIAGTAASSGFAAALFLAAAGATLGIGFRDTRVDYGYECIVFVLAACCLRKSMPLIPGLLLALIAVWGFGQLVVGATVYRYATLQSGLRFSALSGTALVSFQAFGSERVRVEFLRVFAWFGAAIAVISVLAYFTSPAKILWIFDAPYPDVWGSFLSRNNFAQFLELAMPVALWFALGERPGKALYLCFAAVMLAAGLASASRAGSVILVLEAMTVLWMRRRSRQARRMAFGLVLATTLFAGLPGIGTLIGRLISPDPYQMRREIAQATIHMIASRPWQGFGLGTFPVVYPEYAVFDVGKAVEHAHNDWLEWAAEGGAGFLAVWAGLALWTARPAVRTGWGIGVLGCFLHGLVDYPFARFGVSAWVFILVGMLIATRPERSTRPNALNNRSDPLVKLQKLEAAAGAAMWLVVWVTMAGLAIGGLPIIGTAAAKGSFRLDNAMVTGNATLFEGATIETGNAASRMELASGARVWLGTESKAKFYGDHMVLEKGEGKLEKAENFRFEARGLTIQPETGNASARVVMLGKTRVELVALSGSFRVLNAHGLLVANLASGRSLAFEPQAADTASKLTGTLRKVGEHYLLTDETTHVTAELAGPGLATEVGNRIEVTGAMDPTATPVTDASQFIRVSAVKSLGNSAAAAAGKGGGAGGAATSHGFGTGATIAIIGGVAAAATLGGLAAAGTLSGSGSSVSR